MTENKWQREVEKVARRAVRDWPDVVEQEDLVQEIWVHILRSPATQESLTKMDDNDRYRTLHRIAQRIASKERDDFEVFTGNFRYSVGEVKELLVLGELAFQDRELGSSWSVGSVGTTGEHSDHTASSALDNLRQETVSKDLSSALESLRAANQDQYEALVARFVDGVVPGKHNKALGAMVSRALTSLTNRMNRAHKRQHVGELVPGKTLGDGPGTRKAISNAAAHVTSSRQWDGDYQHAVPHLRDNVSTPEVWD